MTAHASEAVGRDCLHASCVVMDGIGVLLRGASGAGKSDLTLRLLALGAGLVADDQVIVTQTASGIAAMPPPPLAGWLEVRGLGVVSQPWQNCGRVELVIDLVAADQVPRWPDESLSTVILGTQIPLLRLCPWEVSAPLKVRLAVRLLKGDIIRPS